MSVSKGELLYYIFEARGVTVDEAANWYGVDKEYAREKLEKFYEEGLVEKAQKLRGMVYTITEKGLDLLGYYVI